MPLYNSEDFVREAIESILNQTFKDFELIIIDDASTDNSFEICKEYKDGRIKLVRNEVNLGVAQTRNRALSMARGEYIALLDSDDISLSNRIQVQFDHLEANHHIALIGSRIQMITEDGKNIVNAAKGSLTNRELKTRLLFVDDFATSSLFFRVTTVNKAYFNQEYTPAEDYRFLLDVSKNDESEIIEDVLVQYRVRANSLSNDFLKSQKAEHRILKEEITKLGISCADGIIKLANDYFKCIKPIEPRELALLSHTLKKIKQTLKESTEYDYKVFEDFIIGCDSENDSRLWQKYVINPEKFNPNLLYKFYTKGIRRISPKQVSWHLKFIAKCLSMYNNPHYTT